MGALPTIVTDAYTTRDKNVLIHMSLVKKKKSTVVKSNILYLESYSW